MKSGTSKDILIDELNEERCKSDLKKDLPPFVFKRAMYASIDAS